jgi:hypothetical protein
MNPSELLNRIVSLAQQEFQKELESDFARVRRFDGFFSKEIVATLLGRADNDLMVLARILPLGVFSEDPISYETRKRLTNEERSILLKFRRDYDTRCAQNSMAGIEHTKKLLSRRISTEFKTLCHLGTILVRTTAKDWGWTLLRGAPGEWGLSRIHKSHRLTICFRLSRAMELSYSVAIAEEEPFRWIRQNDEFLAILGLGIGTYDAGDLDLFRQRFEDASVMGKWHIDEYMRIMEMFERDAK